MKIVLIAAAVILGIRLLAMLVAAADGFSNRWRAPRLTASQLADQIQVLIDESGWGNRDLYDELVCVPINRSPLERYRKRIAEMGDKATGDQQTRFTAEQKDEMRQMVEELRRASAT